MVNLYFFIGFIFFMASSFIFSDALKKSKIFATKLTQFSELKSDEQGVAIFVILAIITCAIPCYFFISMYLWPVLLAIYIVFYKQIQEFLCQI